MAMTIEHNPTDALCELMALNAEVYGMTAENLLCQAEGRAPVYDSTHFFATADKMRALKEGGEEDV